MRVRQPGTGGAAWLNGRSRPPGRYRPASPSSSRPRPPISTSFSVLGLLHDLAVDDSTPEGARFETFLYADRILGLDLPGEIGRLDG